MVDQFIMIHTKMTLTYMIGVFDNFGFLKKK